MNQLIIYEYVLKAVTLALALWLGLHVNNLSGFMLYLMLPLAGLLTSIMLGARNKRRVSSQNPSKPNLLVRIVCSTLERPFPNIFCFLMGFTIVSGCLSLWLQSIRFWHVLIDIAIGGLIGWTQFAFLQHIRLPAWSKLTAVIIVAASIGLCLHWTGKLTGQPEPSLWSGLAMLLCTPALFVMVSIGHSDETEWELSLVGLVFGLALWLALPETVRILAVVLPILLLVLYIKQYLPTWLAFKHTLCGLSSLNDGNPREAILQLRTAMRHAPNYREAQSVLWQVHRQIQPKELQQQPQLLALLDFELCLQRVRSLLLQSNAPSADQLQEALQLLTLILDQRPHWQPIVYYWRAVAHTHAGELAKAGDELQSLLAETNYSQEQLQARDQIHLLAWQLALRLHPQLRQRVGEPLLQQGLRMAAIAVVEQALAKQVDDPIALDLKQCLYADLTESEYLQSLNASELGQVQHFDHVYCFALGKEALQDPLRWRDGVRWLKIAAQGQPKSAPAIYRQIAQAAAANSDHELAAKARDAVIDWGRRIGPDQLTETARDAYFQTVKQEADQVYQQGRWDDALRYYQLYAAHAASGAETMRLITELYEKQGDVPHALVSNAQCMIYDAEHPLHRERQDKYYYSLTPALYHQNESLLKAAFDVAYCINKARELLDHRQSGPEQVDWALHLAELAGAVVPTSVSAHVLAGRARLRRGETDQAKALLEFARQTVEGQWTKYDHEDDWFLAHRLLGDLYLEQGMPAQAVACFAVYRRATQSGAATVYKMGQAYEQLDDVKKAIACYEHVGIYDNPLAADARNAISRLKSRRAN